MTMMSAFSDIMEDVGVPVLQELLGDAVSYSAGGASAVAITGLFALDDSSLIFDDDGSGVISRGTLRIRNSATGGIALPTAGDCVAIGGKTWYVKETPATPSWASYHDLSVVQYAPIDKSRRDHRIAR